MDHGFAGELLRTYAMTRRLVAETAPPGSVTRDLIDLVEAYTNAFPEERAAVTRIFLVTTHGLTARPGGVNPCRPPDLVASNLAALTAEVLFGQRDLRSALRPPAPPARPARL